MTTQTINVTNGSVVNIMFAEHAMWLPGKMSLGQLILAGYICCLSSGKVAGGSKQPPLGFRLAPDQICAVYTKACLHVLKRVRCRICVTSATRC